MTTNITIRTTTGSDVETFVGDIFDNLAGGIFTNTSITGIGANGDRAVLQGSFSYSGTPSLNTLTGGTVTKMTLVDNPGSILYSTATLPSLDAATVVDTLLNGTRAQFYALLGPIKFNGNDGADIFAGGTQSDSISGGAGNDILSGKGGNDTIEGGAGADNMRGDAGIDTLSYSDSGARVIVSLTGRAKGGDATGDSFSGFESLTGSDFNDKLTGNASANTLSGGKGNDILRGAAGADVLIGGGGKDTADYTGSNAGVTVNLATNAAVGGHANGDSFDGIENILGSTFADSLTGDIAVNILRGGGGNDTLFGGANDDRLDGNAGNDRLIGGSGHDTLFGRAGGDIFVLSNTAASSDRIKDYVVGTDMLEVDASVFRGGLSAAADLDAAQVEVNTTGLASTADVRFILNSDTGQLYYDINGSIGDDTGSRLVAVLQGTLAGFSNTDFDIV